MNKVAIKVSQLCKCKGKRKILDNVSFEIEEGKIIGFLGPNGSGKTTTMKCILDLYKYDGKVEIFGESVENKGRELLHKLGATIEAPSFYSNMSGLRNLKLEKAFYPTTDSNMIYRLIEEFGMSSYIDNKVSTYSLGMKQRLSIAMAMVHSPRVLLLDEPMNGLDPEGIYDLRALLIKLSKEHQTTILVSSHILSEMQQLCDSVIFIREGKILGTETSENNLEDKYMELMGHRLEERGQKQ